MGTADTAADYDVAIIGGGINGSGIARDAAGRGWRVFLCDKADLASGTSSASTKLIHGGLRYLEQYEFRLVREALIEREVLWGIAPHIIRPLRFVLPHHRGLRPAWLLRLGLFLYDHLGGRKRLPPTRTLRLRSDPAGAALKPDYALGFEYSDCWVDDARLVVLNARDAADRGAAIEPRTACVAARRHGRYWTIDLRDELSGERRSITARALVNAAGPWVGQVATSVIHAIAPAAVRLVRGSHIVVRKIYEQPTCYIFQNADGRIFFVIPYERDFTLIGTTDQDFTGDPERVRATEDEIDYLCGAASHYLRTPVTPESVVRSYSGVRSLFDDGAGTAQEATRDYVLKLDASAQSAALVSVFGGKITTYRRLAEAALAMLEPHLPPPSGQAAGWTGRTPLPGGGFPIDGFEALLADVRARYAFLPEPMLHRMLRAYGTRIHTLLVGASNQTDLGAVLGGDLTERELRYLVHEEWVRTAEDAVWRRSKIGLRLSPVEIAAIDAGLQRILREDKAAA